MKVCRRPFHYLYLDHFDGKVWLCPWTKREHIIGNLFATSLQELWIGEKASRLRNMVASGDFSGCRLEGCPFLQRNSLPDQEGEEREKTTTVAPTPEMISLAHDFLCNQYCVTCRRAKFVPRKDYAGRIRAINGMIAPWLDKADHISLAGHGDPFASPYMMELLQNLRPNKPDYTIALETNGVYFDERHWNTLSHLAECNLQAIVTINSFDPFLYRHISLGGNYGKLMKNLDFIAELRQKKDINALALVLVIQDRNFREIPSFIETCLEKYRCDNVILRPVYQWGTMPEETFWFKDVLNPLHPYHREYLEIISHPILSSPKVYHFGGDTLHPARPFPGYSIPAPAKSE